MSTDKSVLDRIEKLEKEIKELEKQLWDRIDETEGIKENNDIHVTFAIGDDVKQEDMEKIKPTMIEMEKNFSEQISDHIARKQKAKEKERENIDDWYARFSLLK